MSEPVYCTAVAPELQLISKCPPREGQHMFGLTVGGRLIETSWGAKDASFFVAWMPFPKMSQEVRNALYEAYKNGGVK